VTRRIALLFVVVAAAAIGITCGRDDGAPDPPLQTLVPCDEGAAPGAPEACPPGDARLDAMRPDARVDAAVDAPSDAPADAPADQ
jgi:hypothetical protein